MKKTKKNKKNPLLTHASGLSHLPSLCCSEVAQSCPTLCDPMDSSLHQAPLSMVFSRQEVLEWVAISFSRESFQLRDGTQVSHTVARRFTVWATRELQVLPWDSPKHAVTSPFSTLYAFPSASLSLFLFALVTSELRRNSVRLVKRYELPVWWMKPVLSMTGWQDLPRGHRVNLRQNPDEGSNLIPS